MSSPPSSLTQRLLALYPVLAELPGPTRDAALAEHAQAITLPEGQLLFDEGGPCRGFPMVLSGEVRVASTLLGHGGVVQGTHQALADELSTVREIVTRLLKRFERAGWVVIGRERVEILDAAALRTLAAGSPVGPPP